LIAETLLGNPCSGECKNGEVMSWTTRYKRAMFRRILLPLDGSLYADAALDRACEVASKHGAEITGVVVLNTPELLDEEKLPFNAHLLDLKRKGYFKRKAQVQKRIGDIVASFKATCEERGVAHREAELQGIPSECILEESVYYDLIVIGMKTYFHLDPNEKGESLDEVLDHAEVPVLTVPRIGEAKPFQNVLLAFNGSYHSARALREFVELSEPYEVKITLLISDKDEEHAAHCLQEALTYLEANGVTQVEQVRTEKDIISAIAEDYLGQVDLVVAGLHSKNVFKNFFVGSLIKHFIEEEKVPLFIG